MRVEDPESEGNHGVVQPNEIFNGHIVERIIPNYGSQSSGHVEIYPYSSTKEKQYASNGFSHKNSHIALQVDDLLYCSLSLTFVRGVASPKVSAGIFTEREKFTKQEFKRGPVTMDNQIVATCTVSRMFARHRVIY
jgi:hypothetical protein